MRFAPSFRANSERSSGRKPVARQARLKVELLENRALLSAAPLAFFSQDASIVLDSRDTPHLESFGASAVPTVAGAAQGDITLYRNGSALQTFSPATDTNIDRGMALRAALAAAQPGDELTLGPATYDTGGDSHVEFPRRVTVTGAGQAATKITSSCPQSVDGNATFTINNGTVIQDCWLEGSLHNGLYQPLVGMQGGPTEDITAYLRRDKITGDTDGIFLWTGSVYRFTIYAYDCNISTNYDAVAVLGSGLNRQDVELFNCSITVAQPDPTGQHISNCINLESGTVELSDCTLTAIGDAGSIQTTGVWTWNQGSSTITNCTFNVSAPAGLVYDLYIQSPASCTVVGGQGSGPHGTYMASSATQAPTAVAARNIFYNNCFYDGNDPAPGAGDDAAIASDKTAMLPGQTATFANVTGYSKGINGVMIDLSGIHGNVTADDFIFTMGNDNSPSAWLAAPAPASTTVRRGEGVSGSDRIEFIWADGAIRKQWLEVIVKATANTGLAANDMFFYGNEVGDTGLNDSAAMAKVDAVDVSGVQAHGANNAANIPVTNVFDFDKDHKVGSTDVSLAQANGTNNATGLMLIAIPSNGPFAPEKAALAATSGDAGVASALAGTSAGPRSTLSAAAPWIANRLHHLDLSPRPITPYLEGLALADTPNPKPDQMADNSGLYDHLLDLLGAELGLAETVEGWQSETVL